MAFVYIVRCNFNDPAREQAWNDWYSGPKIAQMLRKPHFLSCQRFRRETGTGRGYLALWVLTSPDAFKTKEYTTNWGFFEWESCIVDWSRDLFDGGSSMATDFAVPMDGGLHVVSFDGASAEQANVTRAANDIARDMTWMPIAGLDRHTPIIGVRVINGRDFRPLSSLSGSQEALYRPISDFARAEKP